MITASRLDELLVQVYYNLPANAKDTKVDVLLCKGHNFLWLNMDSRVLKFNMVYHIMRYNFKPNYSKQCDKYSNMNRSFVRIQRLVSDEQCYKAVEELESSASQGFEDLEVEGSSRLLSSIGEPYCPKCLVFLGFPGNGCWTLLPSSSTALCYETVRELRWPEGVRCPYCDMEDVIRRGRDETQTARQRYECKACGRRFDDLTETVFAGHHQPLTSWILCLYFMGLNLSNQQIAQELDINQDDVHQMTTQLREGIKVHSDLSIYGMIYLP